VIMGPKVGAGASGQVFRARYGAVEIAVKHAYGLGVSIQLDEAQLSEFSDEVSTLRRLAHPNIVRFYGIGKMPDPVSGCLVLALVTEYCKMSLAALLEQHTGLTQHTLPVRRFVTEIAEAMQYLHRNHVLHCDLKPQNVLVSHDAATGEEHCKLCDFGIARKESLTRIGSGYSPSTALEQRHFRFGSKGTPGFIAPEAITDSEVVGFAAACVVDVFAFGVLVAAIYTLGDPYSEVCEVPRHRLNAAVLDRVDHPPEGLRPTCGIIHRELLELLHQCWAHDATKRPQFTSIVHQLGTITFSSPRRRQDTSLARSRSAQ